jgi:hypothetical protein
VEIKVHDAKTLLDTRGAKMELQRIRMIRLSMLDESKLLTKQGGQLA